MQVLACTPAKLSILLSSNTIKAAMSACVKIKIQYCTKTSLCSLESERYNGKNSCKLISCELILRFVQVSLTCTVITQRKEPCGK